jgi:hypothetical protein
MKRVKNIIVSEKDSNMPRELSPPVNRSGKINVSPTRRVQIPEKTGKSNIRLSSRRMVSELFISDHVAENRLIGT